MRRKCGERLDFLVGGFCVFSYTYHNLRRLVNTHAQGQTFFTLSHDWKQTILVLRIIGRIELLCKYVFCWF